MDLGRISKVLLVKDLDAVENHLLDLMEFNDWNLTKQFATAMSKVGDVFVFVLVFFFVSVFIFVFVFLHPLLK